MNSATSTSSPRFALWPLVALTAMNMLNYIDRYVVTALLPNIEADLHLSDGQAGWLGTAFMVVYFMVSPIFGWMGDRGRRPRWLALGVALWSLATAAAGMARSYGTLFLARASVGIGEAAYGTIAPSLLSDYFNKSMRGRILAYFYVATPVGSALGYVLGGLCGAAVGWRAAFFVVGLPGLLLAASALWLEDPPRGRYDDAAPEEAPALRAVYGALWRNRQYVSTVAGYTAYTFAIGGLAFWMPTYMMRIRGYAQGQGMLLFGGISVCGGLAGTLLGGWLGDWLLKRTAKAYPWVNAVSMMGTALGSLACLGVADNNLFLACLFVAQVCMFASTGPVNALIVNSVPAHARATAVATSIFCIHLFGDATSPSLIGHLSDQHGLTQAMMIIPGVFVLAGLVWSSPLWQRAKHGT